MKSDYEKYLEVIDNGKGFLEIFLKDLEYVEEGDEFGLLKSLGYSVMFSTRELMFAPMVFSVFEMMGQRGVKNLFYRGGFYAGERYATETVNAQLADWDDSLFELQAITAQAMGWGPPIFDEINLDIENPRLVYIHTNFPTATTVPEMMKYAVQKNPNLTLDMTQTFCDYSIGFLIAILRLVLKNNGAKDEVLSKIRGKEEYCQAQEGRDECRFIIAIL